MFGNVVLQRMFGIKAMEVALGWGILHSETFHNSVCIRAIRSRSVTLTGM